MFFKVSLKGSLKDFSPHVRPSPRCQKYRAASPVEDACLVKDACLVQVASLIMFARFLALQNNCNAIGFVIQFAVFQFFV